MNDSQYIRELIEPNPNDVPELNQLNARLRRIADRLEKLDAIDEQHAWAEWSSRCLEFYEQAGIATPGRRVSELHEEWRKAWLTQRSL